MEKTTTFISDGFEIEGRLTEDDQHKGVVITHPHPLYGGDMPTMWSTLSAVLIKKMATPP